MKRICLLLIIVALIMSMAGCAAESEKSHSLSKNDSPTRGEGVGPKHTDPTEPETEPPTTQPPTTVPPTTVPPTTLPPTDPVPYLQKIDRPDQEVYSGPGYDYSFQRVIGEEGTFTIVEEAWDNQGNRWGRLKSGIGWVNLSEIQGEIVSNEPIDADYADNALLNGGNYHYVEIDFTEYAIPVVFRANEPLTDIRLYSGIWEDSGVVPDELVYQLPQLTAEKPLVAVLEFPGDFSTYFIQFIDSRGVGHCYGVYTSGYDGSLVCSKQW